MNLITQKSMRNKYIEGGNLSYFALTGIAELQFLLLFLLFEFYMIKNSLTFLHSFLHEGAIYMIKSNRTTSY